MQDVDLVMFTLIAIIAIGAVVGAAVLGTERDGAADVEWQRWLDEHPDAPAMLEADWQQRHHGQGRHERLPRVLRSRH